MKKIAVFAAIGGYVGSEINLESVNLESKRTGNKSRHTKLHYNLNCLTCIILNPKGGNLTMKTLLTLIFICITFFHAHGQIWHNNCVRIYSKHFSEDNSIEQEVRNSIRIENIKRHLNYFEVYNRIYNDTTFCDKLKSGFVDYEDIFGFNYSKVSITKTILDQLEEKRFYLWPYDNSLFFPGINIYQYKTTTLLRGYTFFNIFDEIFDNTGVIAVNDTNFNDVLFIGGNYLPLDNIFPIFDPQFSNLPALDDRHTYPGSVYWYANNLKIPLQKHSLQTVIGYEHYANMLSVFFIAPFENYSSWVHDYNNEKNEFIVRVNVLIHPHGSGGKSKFFRIPPCFGDWDYYEKIRYCYSVRPNIPCNCFNGEVVSSMLVKFNTETNRIQFYINGTKDISKTKECPD